MFVFEARVSNLRPGLFCSLFPIPCSLFPIPCFQGVGAPQFGQNFTVPSYLWPHCVQKWTGAPEDPAAGEGAAAGGGGGNVGGGACIGGCCPGGIVVYV